jgi:hypothetical protein
MQDKATIEQIESKYSALASVMDERMRRQWAGAEAEAYGWGGVRAVSRATGLSPNTIRKGMAELEARRLEPTTPIDKRVRRAGGGRKRSTEADPGLWGALERLVAPSTRGDPESPLRWTSKSTARLAEELTRQGHSVSARTVGRLLKADGYSLQATRKTKEGASDPDRDEQFEHINATVLAFQAQGQPVISVDTKKKELVGEYANKGREWQPKGEPEQVRVHDFLDEKLGKAIPYGVYDVSRNEGWVSVGIDHDTARFAVAAILRWWQRLGSKRYRGARRLLIIADGGGSNGSRSRLWKVALQELADRLGIEIHVCHLPPGTSKWNKIEHRMFSHITQNWRGRPLVSHEVIISLIANTTTKTGLRIRAALDERKYPTGIKVSDEQLAEVNLTAGRFRGDWNYSISPSPK